MHLIEKMGHLLRYDITPVVPLRGSISASGGLSQCPFAISDRPDFVLQIYHRSRMLLVH